MCNITAELMGFLKWSYLHSRCNVRIIPMGKLNKQLTHLYITKANKVCVRSTWRKLLKLSWEISKNLKKGRAIPCSLIERLNIVKMSVLPNLIHRFSVALNRIPAKFKWKGKRHRVANTVLKKNKIRGLRLL